MIKYSKLVETNQKFLTSVNLEYDLDKIDKVKSYIPTEQSVQVLGALLKSFYYADEPQNRATVLIGPYGRGKSHLLLILTALTSLDLRAANQEQKEYAQQVLCELCDKIEAVNPEIGALARTIVESNIRTLPVIVNTNSSDINQSLLVAINNALLGAGLGKLLPDTYFDSALSIISKWKEEFPQAYDTLKKVLKKHKQSVDQLEIKLHQYDKKAYTLFCECYPQIAAGMEFNPLTNMDVVKLYTTVCTALAEQTEYKGINLIYDEFSKFLEANIESSNMLSFKILQDMSEAAVRSGSAQLHFTCITHKDIVDYSASDSFKAVAGRFNHLRFVASSEQSYELIANAIIKTSDFDRFKTKYAEKFKVAADASALTNVFSELTPQAYEQKISYGCFPLIPLSAFALLHISELVGQNERTLFTFLTQSGPNTMRAFVEEEHDLFSLITVDYIYSYFEDLFQKEIFNNAVHSVWAKTDSALRQVSDTTQKAILKAMAVINIIDDDRLKAVPAHLKAALMMDDEVFDNAARALLKQHILSQRDSSEFVLLTANGVDVQKSVDQYVKTRLPKIDVCAVLDRAVDLGFVFPRRYNDTFSMMRYFQNIYMEADTFIRLINGNQVFEQQANDGVVIHIIAEDLDAVEAVKQKVQSLGNMPQIVVCVSKIPFAYQDLLKRYEAISHLKQQEAYEKDPHFIEELEVYEEDLRKRIQSAVHMMYAPSSQYSEFYNCNGELSIGKQVELNQQISRICEGLYNRTPVINNEMVNKNNLNAQNIKGRNLAVEWVLNHAEDQNIPCMDGYGPEVSIFKSVFKYTGLDQNAQVRDHGMNQALNEIRGFIQGCEHGARTFQGIYQILSAPPYGMRKGILPLLIAYSMRQYKRSIVLYFKNREIELTASALSDINEAPESYKMLVETGTRERDQYLDRLQELFRPYEDSRTQSSNRIYTVVKSMQNWVRGLPDYTKKFKVYLENGEVKTIPGKIDFIRSELMKFEINSRELLFSAWPKKLGAENEICRCNEEIYAAKRMLDSHISNFRQELCKQLTTQFMPGYEGGLSRSVMAWYKKLPDTTKTHVFDSDANALLTEASSICSYDDDVLLDSLVAIFVSLEIEDWSDRSAETFRRNIAQAIESINNYVEQDHGETQDGTLMISTGGIKIEKAFAADAISPIGKTVLNNLIAVFDEYNGAIEPDEQLNIITKLINEILH